MDTYRQVFGNNDATTGACLRCASWVDPRDTPTSVCSFVGSELHELTPGHIRYAACDVLVACRCASCGSDHILNVEFFKGNELVLIDQLARFLMGKVTAAAIVWAVIMPAIKGALPPSLRAST